MGVLSSGDMRWRGREEAYLQVCSLALALIKREKWRCGQVCVYIGDHKIPVGVLSGSDTAGEWALILCFFCSSRCSLLAASV